MRSIACLLLVAVTFAPQANAKDRTKRGKNLFGLKSSFSRWTKSDKTATSVEPSKNRSTSVKAIPASSATSPNVRLVPLGPSDAIAQTRPYDPEVTRDPLPEEPEKPETSPNQLKKISEINPFADYEPDASTRDNAPCENLCPRPDGLPCERADGTPAPECPEMTFSDDVYMGRNFGPMCYRWEASNNHYNPLYFEDVALERYGHAHHELVQPFVSVGKFGAQLFGLPYQMVLHPVREDVYPLGYYKPGEPAPRLIHQVPLNAKAAAVTAGVYTGLIFALP